MRSVILRSRPGRPRWQLTTRPATAVLLGVVSLVAAGAQLALLSSPTPWYQWAVAGFWGVVGLAFLGSAVGTRARDRRAAQASRRRVPADPVPFVPVPIRPARSRRDGSGRDGSGRAGGGYDDERRHDEVGGTGEVHTGDPTDDLADAVQTAATPIVTAGPVAAAPPRAVPPRTAPSRTVPSRTVPPGPAPTVAVPAMRPAPEPVEEPEPVVPTTRTRNRHAVRAVLSVETASREIPLPAVVEETPAPTTGSHRIGRSRRSAGRKAGIRDGRVRSAPKAGEKGAGEEVPGEKEASRECRRTSAEPEDPGVPETRRPAAAEPARPPAALAAPAVPDAAAVTDEVRRPPLPEVRRPATAGSRRPAPSDRPRPAAPAPRDHVPAAPSGAVPGQRQASEGPRREHDRGPGAEKPRPAEQSVAVEPGNLLSRMTFGGGQDRVRERRSSDALSIDALSGDAPSRGSRPADPGRRPRGLLPADTGRHALADPREVPAPRENGSASPSRARHAAPGARAEIR